MGLRDFDVFPKLQDEYRHQAQSSGVLTIVSVVVMAYLFVSQTVDYFADSPRQRLRVDEAPLPTNGDSVLVYERLPKLAIHLDVLLPALPCPFVNLGVFDAFKQSHDEAFARVKLRRLDAAGNAVRGAAPPPLPPGACGPCYGARAGCCNSCREVKRAFRERGRPVPPLATLEQCRGSATGYANISGEQCRVSGTVVVPRVRGVLYLAPGDVAGARSGQIADYEAMGLTVDDFNLSHAINEFYVGESDAGGPGISGVAKEQRRAGRFKALYFVSIVRERAGRGEVFRTRVHHYERYREGASRKYPGVFFFYDVAPVVVEWERAVPPLRFLVELMAVLGGVYSLGMFVDHLLHIGAARAPAEPFP
jgi:hypothetical protein